MESRDDTGLPFEAINRSLRMMGLRSEGCARGTVWVKSRIADLKIDLWLATEHGEAEKCDQTDTIRDEIEILEPILRPSIFDPDPNDPSLILHSAAADLAQYALFITKLAGRGSFANTKELVGNAIQFLEAGKGLQEATICLKKTIGRKEVLSEDVQEIVKLAVHQLENFVH